MKYKLRVEETGRKNEQKLSLRGYWLMLFSLFTFSCFIAKAQPPVLTGTLVSRTPAAHEYIIGLGVANGRLNVVTKTEAWQSFLYSPTSFIPIFDPNFAGVRMYEQSLCLFLQTEQRYIFFGGLFDSREYVFSQNTMSVTSDIGLNDTYDLPYGLASDMDNGRMPGRNGLFASTALHNIQYYTPYDSNGTMNASAIFAQNNMANYGALAWGPDDMLCVIDGANRKMIKFNPVTHDSVGVINLAGTPDKTSFVITPNGFVFVENTDGLSGIIYNYKTGVQMSTYIADNVFPDSGSRGKLAMTEGTVVTAGTYYFNVSGTYYDDYTNYVYIYTPQSDCINRYNANLLTQPVIRYVDDDATGLADGTGWANAYTDLQAAIDASQSGDTVKVAGGSYQPAAGRSFELKEGVAIVGGYNTATGLRDGTANSVLQGNGNSVVQSNRIALSRHSLLDGFTITGGNTADRGGGMFIGTSTSPVVSNCVFANNTADSGGGLGLADDTRLSVPLVVNCTFYGNTATADDSSGAIYAQSGDFVNNLLYGNTGDTTADPMFVNAATGDFRLQACSPAINAGNNTVVTANSIATDMAGDLRIAGGIADLGAYEFQNFVTVFKNDTACEHYTFGGNTYTQSGTYYANNCDTLTVLNLGVKHNDTAVVAPLVCSRSSYTFFGEEKTANGTYYHTIPNVGVHGCDSVYMLNLTLNHNDTAELNVIGSYGYDYTFYDSTWTTDGTYFYTETGAAPNGCDKVYKLNLTFGAPAALNFDGVDDYVQILNPLTTANGLTIEYWLKTDSTYPDGANWYNGTGIVDAEVGGSANDFGTSITGTKLSFGIGNPDKTIKSTSDVNSGNWVHAAATWNKADGVMKLYINGRLEATETGAANFRDAPTGIKIGTQLPAGTNGYFNGDIDEVRIWNVVRSQAQITGSMYCRLNTENGLAASYHFNDGTANDNNTGITTVADVSVNSNNGTLNNFALTGSTSNFTDNVVSAVQGSDTVAACDSYTWYNTDYTASGTYFYTNDCGQTDTLMLTINHNDTSAVISSTVCDRYTFRDTVWTQSGTYYYTEPGATAHGCDSVYVIHLVVKYSDTAAAITAYAYNSYTYRDSIWTASGIYYYKINVAAANGCDSVYPVNLTIYTAGETIDTPVCETFEWKGQPYTQSATVYDTIATMPTADSTFAYTGADQTFVVPKNVGSLYVELWGAGGGYAAYSPGGGGAYLSGTLRVHAGETLTIIAGDGGAAYYDAGSGSGYGGGGAGGYAVGTGNSVAGGGGGRSAIQRSGTDIVTAGGGGGGTGYNSNPNAPNSPNPYGVIAGGGGGGGTGSGAGDISGSANYTNGSNGINGGGGGGSFYSFHIVSGEGGADKTSGFTGSFTESYGNGPVIYGNTATPGNTTSPHYVSDIGSGGGGVFLPEGGNGLVYISWVPLAVDTVITYHFTVNRNDTATVVDSACYSYTFRDATWTQSGTYYYTQAGAVANGCDSVYELHLTISNDELETINASVTNSSSYTFRDSTWAAMGTHYYKVSGATAHGCDSIYQINLTFYATGLVIDTTACESFTLNGQTYTQNTTLYDTIEYIIPDTIFAYTGADQIFVVPAGVTALNVELWAAGGGSGWWTANGYGGYSPGGGGAYVSGTLSVNAGETLTIVTGGGGRYAHTSSYLGRAIGGYGGGGDGAVSSSGIGSGTRATTGGSGGGRSAIQRGGNDVVTAGGGGGGYGDISAAPHLGQGGNTSGVAFNGSNGGGSGGNSDGGGQGGASYTNGAGFQVMANNNGGTSSWTYVYVNGTYRANSPPPGNTTSAHYQSGIGIGGYQKEAVAAGNGLVYIWWVSAADEAQADTIVGYNITVNHNDTVTITDTACDSYTLHDSVWAQSGTYRYTAAGATAHGCDSIYVLDLTINQSTHNTETQTACNSYTWHDSTYNRSRTYTYNYTNEDGCASTDTLKLIIHEPTHQIINMTAYQSYTWRGTAYTASGTYYNNYTDDLGCASMDTLNLTISGTPLPDEDCEE